MRPHISQLRVGDRAQHGRRTFVVQRRWPEGRGPGYTEVRFEDGEVKTFCWDYENPEVDKT
jgi:hypothetical protein